MNLHPSPGGILHCQAEDSPYPPYPILFAIVFPADVAIGQPVDAPSRFVWILTHSESGKPIHQCHALLIFFFQKIFSVVPPRINMILLSVFFGGKYRLLPLDIKS